jgi:hypothetical protein
MVWNRAGNVVDRFPKCEDGVPNIRVSSPSVSRKEFLEVGAWLSIRRRLAARLYFGPRGWVRLCALEKFTVSLPPALQSWWLSHRLSDLLFSRSPSSYSLNFLNVAFTHSSPRRRVHSTLSLISYFLQLCLLLGSAHHLPQLSCMLSWSFINCGRYVYASFCLHIPRLMEVISKTELGQLVILQLLQARIQELKVALIGSCTNSSYDMSHSASGSCFSYMFGSNPVRRSALAS